MQKAGRHGSTVVFLTSPNPGTPLVAFMAPERARRASAAGRSGGEGASGEPLCERAEKLRVVLERRDGRVGRGVDAAPSTSPAAPWRASLPPRSPHETQQLEPPGPAAAAPGPPPLESAAADVVLLEQSSPRSARSAGRRGSREGDAAAAAAAAAAATERAASPSAGGDVVGGLPLTPFLRLPRGQRETFADTLSRAVCTIDRLPKIARLRPRPEDRARPPSEGGAGGGGGGAGGGAATGAVMPERPVCAPVGIFRHLLFSPVAKRKKAMQESAASAAVALASPRRPSVARGAATPLATPPPARAPPRAPPPPRSVSGAASPVSSTDDDDDDDDDPASPPAAAAGAGGGSPRLRRPLTQLVMAGTGLGESSGMGAVLRDTAGSARARSALFYAPSAVDGAPAPRAVRGGGSCGARGAGGSTVTAPWRAGTYADIYTNFDTEMRRIRDAHSVFYAQSPTARVRAAWGVAADCVRRAAPLAARACVCVGGGAGAVCSVCARGPLTSARPRRRAARRALQHADAQRGRRRR